MSLERFSRSLVCLVAVSAMVAQSEASSGTSGAAFLNIPVGAAPAAMGGAYSALATDAYGPVYNPGAMAFAQAPELVGQHLEYLESIHYEHLGFVYPTKAIGSFGLSVQYLGSGDITGRDPGGTLTDSYSSHYGAYTLSYGIPLKERLGLGLSAKLIEAKLSDVSGHAYGGDLGLYYKATDKISLAAVMTNAGSDLKFISEGDPLPLAFKVGAAYQSNWHWKVAVEGTQYKEGLTTGQLGIEWKPISMIALRAGYKTLGTKEVGGVSGVTTGIGITLLGQEFSYAWLPYGDLGSTQYFSIAIRFSGSKDSNNLHAYDYRFHREATVHSTDEENSLRQLLELSEDNQPERVVRNHE